MLINDYILVDELHPTLYIPKVRSRKMVPTCTVAILLSYVSQLLMPCSIEVKILC